MALLQIAEPGQTAKPHQARLVIGIDLGTTNSLVAAARHGVVDVLPDDQGRFLLPSAYAVDASGRVLLGYEALACDDSFTRITSVKRILGHDYAALVAQGLGRQYELFNQGAVPALSTAYRPVTPIDISAVILYTLKKRAEASFGNKVDGAVITVPAYFDESQRQATKDAAEMAGIKVLRLINEPTAAALAYGLDRSAKGSVVVFDLGGGTFDVSVLELSAGVFEVKATAGDIVLGGDDFDQCIINHLQKHHALAGKAFPYHNLRQLAKRVKEQLTNTDSVEVSLSGKTITIEKSAFDTWISPLVDKTIDCTRQALNDAGLSGDDIEHIVMVGGATRVPLVKEKLQAFFATNVLSNVDPDRVVAIGAGIAAENLSGNKANDSLLLDVTPLSLGVETSGELVEVIIPRNTPIPIEKNQVFTTYKNGQTGMLIHVVQGERDRVIDCRSLAKFSLKGIPPMTAGAARVLINFAMDADGLLTVSAIEETTGKTAEIDVVPSYGLGDGQVASMLLESIEHAEGDIDFRRLHEQQVAAERVLDAMRQALTEDAELLSENEAKGIISAIQALERAKPGDDADAIKQAVDDLEKAADNFIEKRMNQAVKKVLKNQSIEQFK